MYKLCIIGLSIIFILSINGVWSKSICDRFEGSWVFFDYPTLQKSFYKAGANYHEQIAELRHTANIHVTSATPIQAVWYPKYRDPVGGAFIPYSHYFLLKLHQFEANELSIVNASREVGNKMHIGMLFCKKFYGRCGRNYRGQISYVNDGDQIGIYIYPYDAVTIFIIYFKNNVKVGKPERMGLNSFRALFPGVTFTRPGKVTMMEYREEPPLQLLDYIEFMTANSPLFGFDTLMDYYKSKKPNDSQLFNFNKYENMWLFRDGFIVCKSHADQFRVPRLIQSKEENFPVDISINYRNEKEIRLDFVFYLTNSSSTFIKKDLVNNKWGKFSTVIRSRMLGPRDIQVFEIWLASFLPSVNTIFLGPNGKSVHLANDKCAINLKYKFNF